MKSHSNIFILTVVLSLLVASCKPPVTPPVKTRMAVLIYMAADNNLLPFAKMDIQEIDLIRPTLPSDCRIVVHMDSTVQSTDSLHMLTVLQQMVDETPADQYALVLWSHGRGWLDWGVNRNKQRMPVTALRWVLDQLPHMDYLLFDACHMQCVEVAYELRYNTDYIIASPAETPGTGAPYDRIAQHLFTSPASQAACNIATTYFNYYRQSEGLVISVIDTHALDTLARTLIPTLRHYCAQGQEPELWGVQHYSTYSHDNDYLPDFYDLGSLYYRLTGSDIQPTILHLYTRQWPVSLNAIYHQMDDSIHSAAISMFVPSAAYSPQHNQQYIQKYRTLQWGAALMP